MALAHPRIALVGAPLCGRFQLLRSISKFIRADIVTWNEPVPALGIWPAFEARLLATSTDKTRVFYAPGVSPPNLIRLVFAKADAVVLCVNADESAAPADQEFVEEYWDLLLLKPRLVAVTKVDLHAPDTDALRHRFGETTLIATSSNSGRGISELVSAIDSLLPGELS